MTQSGGDTESEQLADVSAETHASGDAEAAQEPVLVCAIGASAGGLAPLEEFFDHAASDAGIAYVVVQHLSPDHGSMMDALLSRHTSMPVQQGSDGMLLRPNEVYLIPPGTEMTVFNHRLRLRDRPTDVAVPKPIDIFFEALASEYRDRAASVIVSGTGSDGSVGIGTVRRAGGLALAQDSSATFAGMPEAAERSGFVDAVLPPLELANAVLIFAKTGRRPGSTDEERPLGAPEHQILSELALTSGIEFVQYKPATINRRMDRRAALTGCTSLTDYATYIQSNPAELAILLEDLLIDVTSFFRDTGFWEQLSLAVYPKIVLEAQQAGRPLRLWIAGSSTGEEVYSHAMLALEVIETLTVDRPQVQIFATDVHTGSLATASAGIYRDERLAGVSAERRERFFERIGDGQYQVRPEMRSLVTFARHNLLTDAPFTRVDLVSCRNLLIYFRSAAQDRALTSMSFALRVGGVLALGQSESPGVVDTHFSPVDRSARIYRKESDAATRSLRHSPVLPAQVPQNKPHRGAAPSQVLIRAYDAVIQSQFGSALLINQNRELIHTIGGAQNWLEVPLGRPSLDVLQVIKSPTFRLTVGSVLRELDADGSELVSRLVAEPALAELDEQRSTLLVGQRLQIGANWFYLVHTEVVKTMPELPAPRVPIVPTPEEYDRLEQLEADLNYTRESLQAAIEEQETSNEELNASNEELIAANEELQSTNEELSSVNEELRTLNDEHQRRLDELLELTADLDQMMSSTDIGMVFLADDGSVRRFNEPAREYFRMRDSDVGRPFADLTSRLSYDGLGDDIEQVFRTGEGVVRAVTLRSDASVHLRLRVDRYELPRHLPAVFVAVVDMSDVVSLSRQERRYERYLDALPMVAAAMNADGEPWFLHDNNVRSQIEPYSSGDDVNLADLLAPSGRAAFLDDVAEIIESGAPRFSFDSALGPNGPEAVRQVRFPIELEGEIGCGVLRGFVADEPFRFDDSTEHAVAVAAIDLVAAGQLIMRPGGELVEAVAGGSSERLCLDQDLDDVHPDDRGKVRSFLDSLRGAQNEAARPAAIRYRAIAEGQTRWFELRAKSMTVDGHRFLVGLDIDQQMKEVAKLRSDLAEVRHVAQSAIETGQAREVDLAERTADLDSFAHVAAHDLKSPLRTIQSFSEIALEEIAADDPASDHLNRVVGAAKRMNALVDSLMTYAGVGRGAPAVETIDLDALVSSVEIDLRAETEAAGATILRSELGQVSGNPSSLRQVIANLISNSLKYRAGRAPVIEITTNRDEPTGVTITLSDNGIGFPTEQAERIFEPFQRLHTSAEFEGSGVGLAICKRVVERHGGQIWATSTEGEGSVFSLRLPDDGEPE